MIGTATVWRSLASGLATVAGLYGLVRASAAPVPYGHGDLPRLRLSWSARPERIEVCRTVSAEELAKLEEHMRQRVACDGRSATYVLMVDADGRRIDETIVRGAGLRHDRPIYLLRDFELSPGVHRVRVSFARREKTDDSVAAFAPALAIGPDTGIFAGRAEREATEHARQTGAAIPPRLLLDARLTFTPHHVAVVTFDAEHGALRLLDGYTKPR